MSLLANFFNKIIMGMFKTIGYLYPIVHSYQLIQSGNTGLDPLLCFL